MNHHAGIVRASPGEHETEMDENSECENENQLREGEGGGGRGCGGGGIGVLAEYGKGCKFVCHTHSPTHPGQKALGRKTSASNGYLGRRNERLRTKVDETAAAILSHPLANPTTNAFERGEGGGRGSRYD